MQNENSLLGASLLHCKPGAQPKAEGRGQSGHAAYSTDIFYVFLKHSDNGLNFDFMYHFHMKMSLLNWAVYIIQ